MTNPRVSTCLVAAAIAVALPLRLQTAQARPDFAGKWVLVVEKSTPATPEPYQREITIAQDAKTITLTQIAGIITVPASSDGTSPSRREEFQHSLTYDLDGAEHPSPQMLAPPATHFVPPPGAAVVTSTTESTYRAIWTRDQLVIMSRVTRTTTLSGGGPTAIRSVARKALWLDPDGLLVVDSITVSDPTPNGATQPAPVPVHSVFRKAS